jgi:hypothetical protein
MVDCATEVYFREDQQMREDPKNDKYQKCSFGQSHNPQNQYWKSQQGQVKKKSRIPNPKLRDVFEILKDLLNCHPT